MISDLGAHMFYCARELMGPVSHVASVLNADTEKNSEDGDAIQSSSDSALIAMRFSGGSVGSIATSRVVRPAANDLASILVSGSRGTVSLRFSPKDGMILHGKQDDQEEAEHLEPPAEMEKGFSSLTSTTGGTADFVRSVMAGQPAVPDFAEGYEVQRLIDASVIADAEHREVEISAVR